MLFTREILCHYDCLAQTDNNCLGLVKDRNARIYLSLITYSESWIDFYFGIDDK